MEIKKAERKQTKMRVALQGPSGSGKTYSSLLLARGMSSGWDKIVVIDTENGSANLYAHLGEYNIINFKAPYTPEKFVSAINLAESSGMEVVVLDSISHEWEGQGGILDIHSSMSGNSFTNWSKVTPRHNAFVQAILNSPCHVIGTIRSKQDYVLTEKNGKHVPEKVGLKGVTRDGMDYEFTCVLDLDVRNNAIASKDRTGIFINRPPMIITTTTGKQIRNWCETGSKKELVIDQIKKASSEEQLKRLYENNPEFQEELTKLFVEQKRTLRSDTQANDLTLNISENGNH